MQASQAAGVDEAQAREYLKQAVRDLIREDPELLREVVEDIVDRMSAEDYAMGLAMQEAERAPDAREMVSREEIDRILRGEHLSEHSGEPDADERQAHAKAA